MIIIDENIGSAKDNMRSAVHNWYKFTAGFSYKFVDVIVDGLPNSPDCIYEPFAGCGTTLVAAQKKKIHSLGNESQRLMCDIINAKLNWDIDRNTIDEIVSQLIVLLNTEITYDNVKDEIHPLLETLFDCESLRVIYGARDFVKQIDNEKVRLFLNLALSQTLHKIALHPIAVPYISRSKSQAHPGNALSRFLTTISQMLEDIEALPHHKRYAEVFNFDSRKTNLLVCDNTCDLCITSPPYLNNLDYGEVSKVHTHFFEYTKDWSDITQNVRSSLVTGATTHYRNTDFNLSEFAMSEFSLNNKSVFNELEKRYTQIIENAKLRHGKKSFHILMMLYFQDMYDVLKEMRRILTPNAHAYLILGDSAPYGIHIPTTQFLGEIAQSVGFGDFRIYKIRSRGDKWKGLSNRHNIELSENILELS
jgi:DNA modification methylase